MGKVVTIRRPRVVKGEFALVKFPLDLCKIVSYFYYDLISGGKQVLARPKIQRVQIHMRWMKYQRKALIDSDHQRTYYFYGVQYCTVLKLEMEIMRLIGPQIEPWTFLALILNEVDSSS